MKQFLLAVTAVLGFSYSYSQCTTTNGTSCVCDDASSNCDLLPDITVSWYGLENYAAGPDEYPQVCTPPCSGNDGRLRITGSTPNIGHGAFTVRGTDYYVCGDDTIYDPSGTVLPGGLCPDGTAARQLIVQRVYHKNGNAMTYTDYFAGAMTYHPTHGHNHVDDWGVFTLRLQTADPNPLNWPIVGDGAKLGFCLMDYGQCGTGTGSTYAHHCKDDNTVYNMGTTLYNADFPNFNHGGGGYNCSVVEQGISSGWTDVYGEHLDGMWINIPPGTCNGNYWIVAEIDPHNFFREENDGNNYTAIPFTLTQQSSTPSASISASGASEICSGSSVTLTANTGTAYLWSPGGETTQSINVTSSGTYTCQVTTFCGTATSTPFTVTVNPAPSAPTVNSPTICEGMSTTLTASGTNITWYDDLGNEVGTGNSFNTPALTVSTTYYAADANINPGTTDNVGPADNTIGAGGNFTSDAQYLIFNASNPFILNSVKVFSNSAANRTIMLLDAGGNLIQSATVMVGSGTQIVPLNFNVPVGTGHQLRVSGFVDLYRNNTGPAYPYTEPTGSCTITGSSAGASYYYFFYDWQITVGYSECQGPQSASIVTVEDCSGIDAGAVLSERVTVFPNPSNGLINFVVDVPGTADVNYTITDLTGRVIMTENILSVTGKMTKNLDLSANAKGTYLVNVTIDGNKVFKKIIIQ